MQLRPAQEKILEYDGGKLAVSAVPGSGKTFTLALLATEFLAKGRIDTESGEQVLVVTYLNSSVDTFRARIRQRLNELGLPLIGFDVRTLHSLSLEIVREADMGYSDLGESIEIADELLSNKILAQAVDGWIGDNPELLNALLPSNNPLSRVRSRTIIEKMAREFIRTAKNQRLQPRLIKNRIESNSSQSSLALNPGSEESHANKSLLYMLAETYLRYQDVLKRLNVIDFDDIIWRAVDLIETRADVAQVLRARWPFVLEDEAQDSVPLQEQLLNHLIGPEGNWVRVGDPNQAITSTFTAADPRHFTSFIGQAEVNSLPLPNSGRSSPRIYRLANALVGWVIKHHPNSEVRQNAFLPQEIVPSPPGDAQPNPSDADSTIKIKVYKHREENELPSVAHLATDLTRSDPDKSIAILTPTNAIGKKVAGHLDNLGAEYDDLLRGGGKIREVSSVLNAVISLLANPQRAANLEAVYGALANINHWATAGEHDSKKIPALLKSVVLPELFLFPYRDQMLEDALPAGVATSEDVNYLDNFSRFLKRLFILRRLPIDDVILYLGDILFAPATEAPASTHDLELTITYQIANEMRLRFETHTDWRLSELAVELGDLANGRRQLRGLSSKETGYEPTPGRISLATQHGAKGLEWDTVFLVGIDNFWIPGDLNAGFQGDYEFLGGDPSAEAIAQLQEIMSITDKPYRHRSATEAAHIEIICERLRLLYVGITRARSNLQISRSQYIQRFNQDVAVRPASVMAALFQFVDQYRPDYP